MSALRILACLLALAGACSKSEPSEPPHATRAAPPAPAEPDAFDALVHDLEALTTQIQTVVDAAPSAMTAADRDALDAKLTDLEQKRTAFAARLADARKANPAHAQELDTLMHHVDSLATQLSTTRADLAKQ